MAIPLLMPDASWSYRLIFDAEGNLGSTLPIYRDVAWVAAHRMRVQ